MKRAAGGVVIDDRGGILLRKPAIEFDGYVWTFPKGGIEHGETSEEAALREVREETGHRCEILGRIPGEFVGGTSTTTYFLMRSLGGGTFDREETAEVRWASEGEAARLIATTRNLAGRERDLAVLHAVSRAVATQREHTKRYDAEH